MRVAHNEGRLAEPGTLIDEHGYPTLNPGVVVVPQSNGMMGAPGIKILTGGALWSITC
jgi:uncharacterized oxidoreductase